MSHMEAKKVDVFIDVNDVLAMLITVCYLRQRTGTTSTYYARLNKYLNEL